MKTWLFTLLFSAFISLPLEAIQWPFQSSKYIGVYPEVINVQARASTHVNAPDVLHQINPHGERLYVTWHLPKKYASKVLEGVLKVRFQNPLQEEIPFKITKRRGKLVYEVVNESYFERGGILAYQVNIFCEGKLVDEYHTSLWTELIQVPIDSKKN